MGRISATGVCQHLHQNMLRTGVAGGTRLRHEGEWRRNRPNLFTMKVCDARAWQVYIGNFELQGVLRRSETEQLRTISEVVAYDHFGGPRAHEKGVLRNLHKQ